MIGSTVAHYRISGKLGEGGMGVVYRAEDTRLGRAVALKFLPPGLYGDDLQRRRFLLEAQAASALNHPAICTIYGIEEEEGRPFIVMECVEGETLREKLLRAPLGGADVIEWGAQVAGGLAAAHAKGIFHRDVKPENVIIGSDGRARILDFGLAKWRGSASLSTPGTPLGTLSYMSPEQIQGMDVDARSDIWSLGVVLYEMLSGRRPFIAAHDAGLLYSIVSTDPPALEPAVPGTPPPLVDAVMRCLARDPGERFQTGEELSSALRSAGSADVPPPRKKPISRSARMAMVVSAIVLLGVAGFGIFSVFRTLGGGIGSIAILPLRIAVADSSIDYLSDGLTESIISKLSRLSTVRVMSRSSVFRFKGKDVDPQAAGKALGVQSVLVGEVVPRDGFVTIRVELLNTGDNTQIWGDQFHRKKTELFALQDDVSNEIVQSLRLRLTREEKERFARPGTENAGAYELYLKGRYHWNKRSRADLVEAVRLFQEASAKDPGYAAAYAALAGVYDVMVHWGYITPAEGLPLAEMYARKALALDGNMGEAHSALANVLDLQYDRLGALKEYQRAIELNPGDAGAHQWYAEELAMFRRFDEAYPLIHRAQELDPLSFIIPAVAAVFYANARDFDRARQIAAKIVELDPAVPMGHLALGLAYTRSGMYPAAVAELQKGVAISDSEETMLGWLGCAYALSGRKEEAVRIAVVLERRAAAMYVSPFIRALLATSLGDRDQAFRLLDEGARTHDGWMGQAYEEILLDPLRADPRYESIVRRLGLAQ